MTKRVIHDMTPNRLGRAAKRAAKTSAYTLWNVLAGLDTAIEECVADLAAFKDKRDIVIGELRARMAAAGMLESGRKSCGRASDREGTDAMRRADGSIQRAARIVDMTDKGLRRRLKAMGR